MDKLLDQVSLADLLKSEVQVNTKLSVLSEQIMGCLLYTSDAADDLLCVDLGGRRIIKKKNIQTN